MKKIICRLIMIILITGTISCNENFRFIVRPIPQPALVIHPPSPGSGNIWIEGEWFWNGHNYLWHDGYWTIPGKSYRWKPGEWKKRNDGWYWNRGHWRR